MGTATNEANDAILNDSFIDNSNDIYTLQTVELDNILEELHISDDDKIITKSIILNIEKDAAEIISSGLIASLPTIGTIQRNLVKDRMKEHNKALMFARSTMTKEKYKEYAKELRRQVKNEIKQEYNVRKILDKFKKSRKKQYDKMVIKYGKAYANLYINSILWLKPVEYSQEIQDQYDKINGVYIE